MTLKRPRWARWPKRLRPRPPAETTTVAVAFFGGLLLIALGVGMLSAAIGVIVLGIELSASAVLYTRNGRDR